LISTLFAVCQEFKLSLYDAGIPNSKAVTKNEKTEILDNIILLRNIQNPEISVFLPSKRMASGQAVVICPGGGYWVLAYDLEGTDIAKYFNSIGVAAIVLKYRLPTTGNSVVPHISPLMDAQRAMRLVRFNAQSWNINPDKIGIMGFSAGGHLASTLGTHFDEGKTDTTDSIERVSCKPNFMVLMYPVISFNDSICHKGSKEALIGKNPDKNLVNYFSNELQVKDNTPPTFICHASDDKTVPVENALIMYKALKIKNIPVELHILSEGGHGFGLALNNSHIASWTNALQEWLKSLNK